MVQEVWAEELIKRHSTRPQVGAYARAVVRDHLREDTPVATRDTDDRHDAPDTGTKILKDLEDLRRGRGPSHTLAVFTDKTYRYDCMGERHTSLDTPGIGVGNELRWNSSLSAQTEAELHGLVRARDGVASPEALRRMADGTIAPQYEPTLNTVILSRGHPQRPDLEVPATEALRSKEHLQALLIAAGLDHKGGRQEQAARLMRHGVTRKAVSKGKKGAGPTAAEEALHLVKLTAYWKDLRRVANIYWPGDRVRVKSTEFWDSEETERVNTEWQQGVVLGEASRQSGDGTPAGRRYDVLFPESYWEGTEEDAERPDARVACQAEVLEWMGSTDHQCDELHDLKCPLCNSGERGEQRHLAVKCRGHPDLLARRQQVMQLMERQLQLLDRASDGALRRLSQGMVGAIKWSALLATESGKHSVATYPMLTRLQLWCPELDAMDNVHRHGDEGDRHQYYRAVASRRVVECIKGAEAEARYVARRAAQAPEGQEAPVYRAAADTLAVLASGATIVHDMVASIIRGRRRAAKQRLRELHTTLERIMPSALAQGGAPIGEASERARQVQNAILGKTHTRPATKTKVWACEGELCMARQTHHQGKVRKLVGRRHARCTACAQHKRTCSSMATLAVQAAAEAPIRCALNKRMREHSGHGERSSATVTSIAKLLQTTPGTCEAHRTMTAQAGGSQVTATAKWLEAIGINGHDRHEASRAKQTKSIAMAQTKATACMCPRKETPKGVHARQCNMTSCRGWRMTPKDVCWTRSVATAKRDQCHLCGEDGPPTAGAALATPGSPRAGITRPAASNAHHRVIAYTTRATCVEGAGPGTPPRGHAAGGTGNGPTAAQGGPAGAPAHGAVGTAPQAVQEPECCERCGVWEHNGCGVQGACTGCSAHLTLAGDCALGRCDGRLKGQHEARACAMCRRMVCPAHAWPTQDGAWCGDCLVRVMAAGCDFTKVEDERIRRCATPRATCGSASPWGAVPVGKKARAEYNSLHLGGLDKLTEIRAARRDVGETADSHMCGPQVARPGQLNHAELQVAYAAQARQELASKKAEAPAPPPCAQAKAVLTQHVRRERAQAAIEAQLAAAGRRRDRAAAAMRVALTTVTGGGQGRAGTRPMAYQSCTRVDTARLRQALRVPQVVQAFRAKRKDNQNVAMAAWEINRRLGGSTTALQRYVRKVDNLGQPYGRAMAITADGTPIQSMPKLVRAILLEATQMDVDMTNAHGTMLAALIRRVDPAAVHQGTYNKVMMMADSEERERMIVSVADHYGLKDNGCNTRREKVKSLLVKLPNILPSEVEGTISWWCKGVQGKRIATPANLRLLTSQIHRARKNIVQAHPEALAHARWRRTQTEVVHKSDEITALDFLTNNLEHEALVECVVAFTAAGLQTGDLIFDGLHVYLPHGPEGKQIIESAAARVSKVVRDKLKFPSFCVRVKPFHVAAGTPASEMVPQGEVSPMAALGVIRQVAECVTRARAAEVTDLLQQSLGGVRRSGRDGSGLNPRDRRRQQTWTGIGEEGCPEESAALQGVGLQVADEGHQHQVVMRVGDAGFLVTGADVGSCLGVTWMTPMAVTAAMAAVAWDATAHHEEYPERVMVLPPDIMTAAVLGSGHQWTPVTDAIRYSAQTQGAALDLIVGCVNVAGGEWVAFQVTAGTQTAVVTAFPTKGEYPRPESMHHHVFQRIGEVMGQLHQKRCEVREEVQTTDLDQCESAPNALQIMQDLARGRAATLLCENGPRSRRTQIACLIHRASTGVHTAVVVDTNAQVGAAAAVSEVGGPTQSHGNVQCRSASNPDPGCGGQRTGTSKGVGPADAAALAACARAKEKLMRLQAESKAPPSDMDIHRARCVWTRAALRDAGASLQQVRDRATPPGGEDGAWWAGVQAGVEAAMTDTPPLNPQEAADDLTAAAEWASECAAGARGEGEQPEVWAAAHRIGRRAWQAGARGHRLAAGGKGARGALVEALIQARNAVAINEGPESAGGAHDKWMAALHQCMTDKGGTNEDITTLSDRVCRELQTPQQVKEEETRTFFANRRAQAKARLKKREGEDAPREIPTGNGTNEVVEQWGEEWNNICLDGRIKARLATKVNRLLTRDATAVRATWSNPDMIARLGDYSLGEIGLMIMDEAEERRDSGSTCMVRLTTLQAVQWEREAELQIQKELDMAAEAANNRNARIREQEERGYARYNAMSRGTQAVEPRTKPSAQAPAAENWTSEESWPGEAEDLWGREAELEPPIPDWVAHAQAESAAANTPAAPAAAAAPGRCPPAVAAAADADATGAALITNMAAAAALGVAAAAAAGGTAAAPGTAAAGAATAGPGAAGVRARRGPAAALAAGADETGAATAVNPAAAAAPEEAAAATAGERVLAPSVPAAGAATTDPRAADARLPALAPAAYRRPGRATATKQLPSAGAGSAKGATDSARPATNKGPRRERTARGQPAQGPPQGAVLVGAPAAPLYEDYIRTMCLPEIRGWQRWMEEDVGGKGHENGLNKHQRVMNGAGQVRNVSGVGATYPMLEADNAGVWKAESSMPRSKYRRLNNDAILMVDCRRRLDEALYKEAGGETQRLQDSQTDDEHERARQGREVTFDHGQQRFCYWQDMVDNQVTALAKWYAHHRTKGAENSCLN